MNALLAILVITFTATIYAQTPKAPSTVPAITGTRRTRQVNVQVSIWNKQGDAKRTP